MGKDCFILQFIGEINNSNLPLFDILPISVYAEENPSQKSRRIQIDVKETSEGSTLKAIGGHFASSYSGAYDLTEVSTDPTTHVAAAFLENTDFNIEVSNKYDIKNLYYNLSVGFKLSDIGFYANNIEVIQNSADGNAHVTGDIGDLGICTKLTLFRNAYATGLYGRLEDLIEKQIANGRTSGTLVLRINTNTITFNKTQHMQANTKYYLVFAASGKLCTIGTGNNQSTEMTQEIGSYDGSTWTWLI